MSLSMRTLKSQLRLSCRIQHPLSGMQSLITRAIERKIDTDRIAMLSSAHGSDVVSRRRLARLLSARAPCSAAWMTALPTEPALFMSAEDFRLALRHRLGLFPSDHMPRHCSCGEILGTNPYHFHSCPRHMRRSVTDRHDSIVKLFAGLSTGRTWRYSSTPGLLVATRSVMLV